MSYDEWRLTSGVERLFVLVGIDSIDVDFTRVTDRRTD